MSTTALRSGQVAAASGVNLQTLRYYERRGLLAAPERSLGGHRLYPPGAVTVVRVIKAAQRLGFRLDEIAELLDVGARRGDRVPAGLHRRAGVKLAEIDAKIADLRLLRHNVADALAAGCDDLTACAQDPCCPVPFTELAEEDRHAEPGH